MLSRCVFTLSLAATAPAWAVDGTITINGEITDQTCKINGSAPPYDFVVTLPKIAASALKKVNDTAGATLFTIEITDCPSTLTGQVKAYFEPGVTTDYDSGNLYAYTGSASTTSPTPSSIPSDRAGAAKASHVEIRLSNPDGTKITLGAAVNMAAGVTLEGSDKKSATLRYLASYVKSSEGAITAGKLVSYVQYSIVYP
ncbi:fimbrial protein [Bordetella trematum]|uniref:fimbrial protein n=1 Tax=Bordetella trematum TaxID=123899 RepID=UPI000470A40D|nr:fimbrial protein [Bordetella trematum]